jgi:rubrerythrin
MEKNMTEEEILNKIDSCIIIEEQAIPVYSNHMKIIFSWSELTDDEKGNINDIFDRLIAETNKHKTILSNIKNKIRADHVY